MLGICATLARLHDAEVISDRLYRRMEKELQANKPAGTASGYTGYWWPINEAGSAARAHFAQKRAAASR